MEIISLFLGILCFIGFAYNIHQFDKAYIQKDRQIDELIRYGVYSIIFAIVAMGVL